jgi:hypothetical protein
MLFLPEQLSCVLSISRLIVVSYADLACVSVAGPQFYGGPRARQNPARCKSGPNKTEGLPRRLMQTYFSGFGPATYGLLTLASNSPSLCRLPIVLH